MERTTSDRYRLPVTVTASPLDQRPVDAPDPMTRSSWLFLAGLLSIGAGVVHAAAAGAHSEHKAAVYVFIALAMVQVLWGCAALVRDDRVLSAWGVLLGGGALAGWGMAKVAGLPGVDGLNVPEPIQLADGLAAALALGTTIFAALALRSVLGPRLSSSALVLAVSAVTVMGTVATAQHVHADGHAHGTAAGGHTHAAVRAYDPTLPIDLSGTPGVTPRQQAEAENLISLTLARLPQWSNAAVAEKAGFRSIGDGFTGTEHLMNRTFQNDSTTLDPDRPESLVYDTTGGGRRLVAAMFMLTPGTPLSAVPPLGGSLIQWHIHDNLCFSASGFIQGLTNSSGNCPNGQTKPQPVPMLHVWITPNPCGPFAALEGIAGGQIATNQVRLCDHLHGTGTSSGALS